MGSQQILFRPTLTRLFINSLLFRFSSFLNVSCLCSMRAGFLTSSSSTASLSLSLFPSPLLSLVVSSLSIPFPQPFPASPHPLPSFSSVYMQQSTNLPGERETEECGGLKQRWFGLKESRTRTNKKTGKRNKKEGSEIERQ